MANLNGHRILSAILTPPNLYLHRITITTIDGSYDIYFISKKDTAYTSATFLQDIEENMVFINGFGYEGQDEEPVTIIKCWSDIETSNVYLLKTKSNTPTVANLEILNLGYDSSSWSNFVATVEVWTKKNN